MSTTTTNKPSVLSDALLARYHERVPIYDRKNRFFFKGLKRLLTAKYKAVEGVWRVDDIVQSGLMPFPLSNHYCIQQYAPNFGG